MIENDPIPGQSSGNSGLELLADVTAESDVDYIDFEDLDINTVGCYILVATIKNPTGSSCTYSLYFNGDTTPTNYYRQNLGVNNSTVSGTRNNNAAWGGLTTGTTDFATIFIARDVDGYPKANVYDGRYVSDAVQLAFRNISKTATVTNITSLRIAASESGGIGAGSRFMLYKGK